MELKAHELKAHKPSDDEKELITRKRTGKFFLDDVENKVNQGFIPAEFAYIQIKSFIKLAETCLKNIEEQTKEKLVGNPPYIYGETQLSYRDGSKTVDYSPCEDVVKMGEHLSELKSFYKDALKGAEKGTVQVLEDGEFVDQNGEIRKLPKWKYNKSSITLTKV